VRDVWVCDAKLEGERSSVLRDRSPSKRRVELAEESRESRNATWKRAVRAGSPGKCSGEASPNEVGYG
jgi:hypothetical protein